MKNEPSTNISKSDKILYVLNEMKTRGNLKGVVFADRNGDLIAENIENDLDKNIFAAMCASVLESAEDLRKNLSSKKMNKIIAELESGLTILMIKCGDRTFLSFILERKSNIDQVLKNIEMYCTKILENY